MGKGDALAKIAILNDEPEVVTLLSRFLTIRGDAFMKLVGETARVIDQVIAFQPDLILIPLYRPPELIGMPLPNGLRDVRGAAMLETVSQAPELAEVPLVVFSFSVRPEELPPARRLQAFLSFPEGLQELNPVISGFIGPAKGSTDDLERLRSSQQDFTPPTPPDPGA
jgi:hypothetical protein